MDENDFNDLLTSINKLKTIKENQWINDFFTSKFITFFANQKIHYEQVRSLFFSSYQKIDTNHNYVSDTKEIDDTVPGLKLLTDFVFAQPKPGPLIDFLTFSVLPSYFKFFCSNRSISLLIDFFLLIRNDKKYTEKQYDLLARVVFASPSFLHFILVAFQPFFTHFIDNTQSNGINELQISKLNNPQKNKDFFFNLIKYKYLFPKETFAVLCLSTDMTRTIRNSFFKYSLYSKKASYFYNLFHLAQNPSYKLLLLLQTKIDPLIGFFISEIINYNPFLSDLYNQILTNITNYDTDDPNKIKDLTEKVNNTSFYNFSRNHEIDFNNQISNAKEPLLIPKDFFSQNGVFDDNNLSVFPEFFQPLFISSKDIMLFNFFNKKSSFFDTSLFDKMTFFFDFNGTLSKYRQSGLKIDANLTKLLKSVSLGQLALKSDTKITSLPDFFDTLINEDKCAPQISKEEAKECCENMRKMQPKILHNLIESYFRLFETLPAKNNFAHSAIFPLLSYMAKITSNQTETLNNLFQFYHINTSKVKFFTLNDYLAHPNHFDDLVYEFISSHKKLSLSDTLVSFKMVNEIGLNFKSFSKIRSSILSIYDQKMSDFLAVEKNYIERINELFGKREVHSFLKSYVLSYGHNFFNTRDNGVQIDPSVRNISDMIIDAFTEDTIMRKGHVLANAIGIILYEIDRLFTKKNSHHTSIGSDDAISVMIGILMRINPPQLVTHMALMNDFYLCFENYNLIIALKVIFRFFNENSPSPVDEESILNRKE